MVRRVMVWYGTVRYGMVWYGMVWYGTVWYGMVRYGKVGYGMVFITRVRPRLLLIFAKLYMAEGPDTSESLIKSVLNWFPSYFFTGQRFIWWIIFNAVLHLNNSGLILQHLAIYPRKDLLIILWFR